MGGSVNIRKNRLWLVLKSDCLICRKNLSMKKAISEYPSVTKSTLRKWDSKLCRMLNLKSKRTSKYQYPDPFRAFMYLRIVDLTRIDSMFVNNPNRDVVEDRR